MEPLKIILLNIFPNSPNKRIAVKLFVNYFIFILTIAHYAVCLWIYVGDKYLLNDHHAPWRIANEQIQKYDNYQIYVFAAYWIFTVITTVGYGDYTGGTTIEYLISIVLEFTGLCVFSVLMYMIT